MRKNSLILVAVVATGLIAFVSVAAARSASSQGHQRYDVAASADLTADQRAAIQAVQSDAPIPVIDQNGTQRGFVRDSDLTARDDRVTAKVRTGFREPAGQVDPQYNALFEALRVLDPVPVIDEAGKTVGYFTSNFVSTADFERLSTEAKATVASLLRP